MKDSTKCSRKSTEAALEQKFGVEKVKSTVRRTGSFVHEPHAGSGCQEKPPPCWTWGDKLHSRDWRRVLTSIWHQSSWMNTSLWLKAVPKKTSGWPSDVLRREQRISQLFTAERHTNCVIKHESSPIHCNAQYPFSGQKNVRPWPPFGVSSRTMHGIPPFSFGQLSVGDYRFTDS